MPRLRFYIGLLRPRGFIAVIAAVLAGLYTALSIWRDEGWERAQPPRLIADVLDRLPWWTWVLVAMGAGLLIIAESAYQLDARRRGEASALASRISALEDSLQPRLVTECRTESGLRLGNDRACLAYLLITNIGSSQIRNAYVQVAEIVEHTPASGGMEPYRQRLYRHQDVFLRWEATEERLHSFHVSANLHVARGRSGDGRYGLVSIGGSLFPGLNLNDKYEIDLVIAADDLLALHSKLFLRMETYVTKGENGSPILWIDIPFEVEFRQWQATDEVEGELDLDALKTTLRPPSTPDKAEPPPQSTP